MRIALASALFFLIGAPSAGAQAGIANGYTLKGELPTGAFGMSAASDIDSDGFQDFAILQGTNLTVLFAPGLYEVLVDNVMADVNDVDSLPDFLRCTPDAFVVVGASGAIRVQWDNAAFTLSTMDNGEWLAARQVSHATTAPGSARTVVGAMADGTTIRRLLERPSTPSSKWLDSHVYDSPKEVIELLLANLDGIGYPEIALVHDDGMQVIDWNGVPLFSFQFPSNSNAAVTVQNGDGRESIAYCATELTGAMQFVAVVTDQGLDSIESLFGNPEVVGVAAGDLGITADGVDDIAFSYKMDHDIPVIESTGTVVPVYSPSASLTLIPFGDPGPAPGNETTPAIVDFDNDGDDDILHANQTDGSYFVYLNPRIDGNRRKPSIDPLQGVWFEANANIELHFDLAMTPVEVTPGTPNVFEMFVYRRSSLAGSTAVEPIYTQVTDLSEYDYLEGSSILHFLCNVPLVEEPLDGCTHFDSIYFVVTRMARRDLNGKICDRYPTRLYGVQGQLADDNKLFLAAHTTNPEPAFIITHPCDLLPGSARSGNGVPEHSDRRKTRDRQPQGRLLSSPHPSLGELGGTGEGLDCLPKPVEGDAPPLTGSGS